MAESEISKAQVRERAYQLWTDAGCPDGRDEEFWHQAARELGEGAAGAAMPDHLPPAGGLA